MMIKWIILIGVILLLLYYIFDVYIVYIDCIVCFTGGPGCGKSCSSFRMTQKLIKRVSVKRVWKNFIIFIKNIFKSKEYKKKYYPRPQVYASIPICFRRFIWSKREWAIQLTYEHLLLTRKLCPLAVTYIDEIGSFATQFEFKNPNIIDNFNEFIRLYRHYTLGGYIVCNDQCSENIVLEVRRRINNVFNLTKFHRIIIIPFLFSIYWVKVRNISISEEIKTIEENNKEDNYRNMFGIMPRKWNYDTYCYSIRYSDVSVKEEERYEELKTHNLLSYPKDKKVIKQTK